MRRQLTREPPLGEPILQRPLPPRRRIFPSMPSTRSAPLRLLCISTMHTAMLLVPCAGVDAQGPPLEIVIGEQVWMTRNLAVDRFRNGDPIPEVRASEAWQSASDQGRPAWSDLANDPGRRTTVGRLYNFFAVTDPRGLCPSGWHVPSIVEWTVLADRMGGRTRAARRLKARSWEGVRAIGFDATPTSSRYAVGPFGDPRTGFWWSSTPSQNGNAFWAHLMKGDDGIYLEGGGSQGDGLAVRCLRDAPSTLRPPVARAAVRPAAAQPDEPIRDVRDGRLYRTVRIGELTWMAENLAYRPTKGATWTFRDAEIPPSGHGSLYDHSTALTVCPAATRLPTADEALTMLERLGPAGGRQLKTAQEWDAIGVGTDAVGFSALPAGSRYEDGSFQNRGGFTGWWLSDTGAPSRAYVLTVSAGDDEAGFSDVPVVRGFSVRCVVERPSP